MFALLQMNAQPKLLQIHKHLNANHAILAVYHARELLQTNA